MKRVVMVVALVLAASLIYAGEKVRIISGNIPITLTVPADSTGFLLSDKWQISDMANGANEFEDFTWDRMFGTFWMSNFTELSTDSAAEGNADTLILRYTFGSGDYSFVAETDTGTIPASEQVFITRDGWANPTLWIGGDSTAATVNPNYSAGSYLVRVLRDRFRRYGAPEWDAQLLHQVLQGR